MIRSPRTGWMLAAAVVALILGAGVLVYGVTHRSVPVASAPVSEGVVSSASTSASPSLSPTPDAAVIQQTRDDLADDLSSRGKHIAVGALDLSTGAEVTYNESQRFETASIVKVDILSTLLWQLQNKDSHLSGSQKTLATKMITHSDNDAASALWVQIGRGPGLAKANKAFGFTETIAGPDGQWGLTQTTVTDQLRLLSVLTSDDSPLSAASRDYILGLMHKVESDQRWGVPHVAAKDATAIYVKNGWLARSKDGYKWIINSIGRIVEPGHEWLVVVLSNYNPTMSAGIDTIQQAAATAVGGLRKS